MMRALSASSVLALSVFALSPAPAASQGLFDTDVMRVSVLPGWRETGMGHVAAIRLELDPGWKTYWRAPGDAGIPPHFDWSASDNVVSVTPHWPVPEIFYQNGLRSVGYQSEVVIPLHIERADANRPITLSGEVQIGVCEEICIPAMFAIRATLPPEGVPSAMISEALADRPMTEREAQVSEVTCAIAPIEDGLRLTVNATMPRLSGDEEVVIETADPSVWVAEPRVARDGRRITAETDLISYSDAGMVLDRSGVRMTVFGAGQAVDIRGCTAG